MARDNVRASASTDLYRVYIQSLMSRRCMREDVAIEMYKRAIAAVTEYDGDFRPAHGTDREGFMAFIKEIASQLHRFDLDVKLQKEEMGKGRNWIILINTNSSDVAASATDLSPVEIALFRAVIHAIIYSYPANSIGTAQALKLTNELELAKMAKSAAETVLASLVSRGWLLRSQRGRYSLSARSMAELRPHIQDEYDDYFKSCVRCNQMVLTGYTCGSGDCDAHLHGWCYDLLSRSNRNVCPTCKTSFTATPPGHLGEAGVGRVNDGSSREGLSRKRKPGQKGKQRQIEGDEEEDELDGEELEEEERDDVMVEETDARGGPSQPRPSWRTSSQRGPSRVPETQVEDDEDEMEEEERVKPARRKRL